MYGVSFVKVKFKIYLLMQCTCVTKMSVQVVDSQYLLVVNEAHRVLVFNLHKQNSETSVSECDY